MPQLANAALDTVKAGGTIVVLALYDDPVTFNPTALVQKEIRLQGSIAYTSDDFGEAVALLSSGRAQADAAHHAPRSARRHRWRRSRPRLSKDRSLKVLVTPGAPPSS